MILLGIAIPLSQPPSAHHAPSRCPDAASAGGPRSSRRLQQPGRVIPDRYWVSMSVPSRTNCRGPVGGQVDVRSEQLSQHPAPFRSPCHRHRWAMFVRAVPRRCTRASRTRVQQLNASGGPQQHSANSGQRATRSQRPGQRPPSPRRWPTGRKQQRAHYQQGNVGIPEGGR
jgi:hypothetical protein